MKKTNLLGGQIFPLEIQGVFFHHFFLQTLVSFGIQIFLVDFHGVFESVPHILPQLLSQSRQPFGVDFTHGFLGLFVFPVLYRVQFSYLPQILDNFRTYFHDEILQLDEISDVKSRGDTSGLFVNHSFGLLIRLGQLFED